MRQPRALLVNEMGGGLGNAECLRTVATTLATAGFHCRLGLPSHQVAEYRRFFPVIVWPALSLVPPFSAERASSYIDLLAGVGFSSPLTLKRLLNAAEKRIAACAPDVLISNFAPLAHLAAKASGIPVIWLGTGYALPPLDAECLPPFRDDLEPMADEAEVLSSIAASLEIRGLPSPATLAEAFSASAGFVCCHRELDMYSQYRSAMVCGVLEKRQPQPLPEQPRILGYLWPDHPQLDLIISGLIMAGIPAHLYIPNASQETIELTAGSRVNISRQALDWEAELQDCSVVLHAGGNTLAGMALSTGRPQIVIPIHLEQAINADRMADLGIAVHPANLVSPEDMSRIIREVVGNLGMASLALSLASRISQRKAKPMLDAIVEQALGLISDL